MRWGYQLGIYIHAEAMNEFLWKKWISIIYIWHGNECGEIIIIIMIIIIMRISRQPSPVTIMIDQKQLENVECFKYLGSILTSDGICTCEIKSRIAMAKAAFSKKKTLLPANWT